MSTYSDPRFQGPDPYAPLKELPSFPVNSNEFSSGEQLKPEQRGSSSVSPPLSWSDLPEGTKSIAITCFDADATTGSGYWHWAVCNIPATVTEVPAGAGGDKLAGVEDSLTLVGDSGKRGYYGSQPPEGHGPHRYLFAVHAVDVEKLDVSPDNTPAVLGFNL